MQTGLRPSGLDRTLSLPTDSDSLEEGGVGLRILSNILPGCIRAADLQITF